jgi:hypothetical protein
MPASRHPAEDVERRPTASRTTQHSATRGSTPDTLLADEQLAAASDTELAHTVAAILWVQHQRALTGGDIDSMVEQAFVDGFTGKGEAVAPWIDGGLLFCPGMRRDKSTTSHECTFVSIDGRWVWDHGNVIRDEMRQVPGRANDKAVGHRSAGPGRVEGRHGDVSLGQRQLLPDA